MRVMAIDYGDARTGVAISDAAGTLTGFTTVVRSRKPALAAADIAALVRSHGVERIVLGFPRNLDGTDSLRALLYHGFADLLEDATGMDVVLWDEWRTTIEAHDILHAAGKRMIRHKKTVDAVAASLILEGYLTFLKRET